MVHRNRSSNISLCRESASQVESPVLSFALVRCSHRRYAKWYYNPEWKQIMGEAFVELKRVELGDNQTLRQRAWQDRAVEEGGSRSLHPCYIIEYVSYAENSYGRESIRLRRVQH